MKGAIGLESLAQQPNRTWADWLFKRSILKQLKFRKIQEYMGPVDGLKCLDIGSDNGVISYKLRQLGGIWTSADLDPRSVQTMRELVETRVYQIDDLQTPFQDDEFDTAVIVDFLEHIPDDIGFMNELRRILRPGGTLILNAPLIRDGWLMRLRRLMGLTEETHGHIRPGYTPESLARLASSGQFEMERIGTHTRTIPKFIDSLMVWAISRLTKKKTPEGAGRGLVVERRYLDKHKWASRLYALIYPAIYLASKLDHLLFFDRGFMIVARAGRRSES